MSFERGKTILGMMAGAAFVAVGLATPAKADAEQMCAERTEINSLLQDKYGEEARAAGVSESGEAAFELFVSPEGTWTVTMTTTNGLTCVMAAGLHWQERAKIAMLPKS